MGQDKLDLGGKPPKSAKGPNPRKQKAAEDRKKRRLDDIQEQEDPLGEFGDGTKLTKDWREVIGIIDKVLKQKDEICWAIVLTRLLQAIFNLNQKNIANHKEFTYLDLVEHLKPKNRSDNRTSMKLQNLKDAINHIAIKGLLKISSSEARTRPGSEVGFHGKWHFSTEKGPSADFIKAKLDISPVVLSLQIASKFHFIGNGIYQVSGVELEEGEIEGHAVLLVGYGYTNDGKLFFVTQNSWSDQH